MSAKIDVDHVTLAYEDKNDFFEAVQDVSFQVEKGEFISILGPSGCGKSTIISSILVLVKYPAAEPRGMPVCYQV